MRTKCSLRTHGYYYDPFAQCELMDFKTQENYTNIYRGTQGFQRTHGDYSAPKHNCGPLSEMHSSGIPYRANCDLDL